MQPFSTFLILLRPATRTRFLLSTAPAPTDISTLSLHDALPICIVHDVFVSNPVRHRNDDFVARINQCLRHIERSEEHTSELQSLRHLVCRLLLEKKKKDP